MNRLMKEGSCSISEQPLKLLIQDYATRIASVEKELQFNGFPDREVRLTTKLHCYKATLRELIQMQREIKQIQTESLP